MLAIRRALAGRLTIVGTAETVERVLRPLRVSPLFAGPDNAPHPG